MSENAACLFVNGLNQVCHGAGFTLEANSFSCPGTIKFTGAPEKEEQLCNCCCLIKPNKSQF